jgi:Asp-tRNA(Asn)/Glu-tRNA(Gln) amidotransferase B subunit
MIAEYELTTQDAFTLTATREFADRFEAAAKPPAIRAAWPICCSARWADG